jgi:hypothetical protein
MYRRPTPDAYWRRAVRIEEKSISTSPYSSCVQQSGVRAEGRWVGKGRLDSDSPLSIKVQMGQHMITCKPLDGGPAIYSGRWLTRFRSMFSPAASCTQMTRPYRCSRRVTARRKRDDYGPTSATTGPLVKRLRQLLGSHTRKTARASARGSTLKFRGALQADAYAGFHHLYGEHIYEAACWAHARRKFYGIHVVHASPTTTEALARIGGPVCDRR